MNGLFGEEVGGHYRMRVAAAVVSAGDAEGRECRPGGDQQDDHDGRQDADVAQVALDIVVLGPLPAGELRSDSAGAERRRNAPRWIERHGFPSVRRADGRNRSRRGGRPHRRTGDVALSGAS
jgi:hypothetical protein